MRKRKKHERVEKQPLKKKHIFLFYVQQEKKKEKTRHGSPAMTFRYREKYNNTFFSRVVNVLEEKRHLGQKEKQF